MPVDLVCRSSVRLTRVRLRGVSLIEVLISILLAAVGLLALAGSNVAAIRYSKMAQYRGTATSLAVDLAERMRANKAGRTTYAPTTGQLDFDAQAAGQSGAPVNSTACETYAPVACTAATLAAYDLASWRFRVRRQLPEGSFYMAPDSLVPTGFDLWVAWRDPAVANPDDNTTESQGGNECPTGLNLGDDVTKSVRCSYFRINL